MSSLSLSLLPPAAPSLAFVPQRRSTTTALTRQEAQVQSKKQPLFYSTPPLKSSFADDTYESAEDSDTSSSSITSNSDNDSDSDASNIKPPATTSAAPNMGASIGAQNVGEMLFNEELLKSGRGDVRVGHIGRWKDFRGNEIVPDDTMVDGPN